MKKWTAMLICLILVLTGCSKPAAPTTDAADAAAQTGSYQDITAFVAEKKADQPLTISGCWQASLEI